MLAYRLRGGLLRDLGRNEEAIAAFRAGLEKWPEDADLLRNLSLLLAEAPEASLRRPEEAVTLAERAVALERGSPRSWRALGVALLRADRPEEALEPLERWRSLRNGGGALERLYLALACAHLGRGEEARGWLEEAAMPGMEHPVPDLERALRGEVEAALGR